MQCEHCQYKNPLKARFCSRCGKSIPESVDYKSHLKKVYFLFFSLLAYIVALYFIDHDRNHKSILIFNLIFAAIVVVFYLTDTKNINRLLSFKNLNKNLILKILLIAPFAALLISIFGDWINTLVFDQRHIGYLELFKDSPAPLLLAIISVGLFPAIFEEIAFRGIVFNELMKFTRLKTAIILSAILFTLLHLSIISILWIFPGGLLFGYLRAKYRTLWYGIIGHFAYNSSLVILEVLIAI